MDADRWSRWALLVAEDGRVVGTFERLDTALDRLTLLGCGVVDVEGRLLAGVMPRDTAAMRRSIARQLKAWSLTWSSKTVASRKRGNERAAAVRRGT